MKEYVYLIFDPFSRLTKIGKSVNPKRRFETCRTHNPYCELIYYTLDFTEKFLHEKFKEKRVLYEWFSLEKNDILFIAKGNKKIVPKRMFYTNTKQDVINREYRERMKKCLDFDYEVDFAPEYKIKKINKPKNGVNEQCFNSKTGRKIKQVYKNGMLGYSIRGKFYSLTRLRKHLVKPVKSDCPF